MPFSLLVGKYFSAAVRTGELAHVEDVLDLPADLALLKGILAEWAGGFSGQPLVEAGAAD